MRKLSLLLAFLAFIAMQLQAQRQITGTVTNADDGSTIPGVSVYVKGDQKTGTVTDINGKFSLKVTENAKALVFSFVGMNTVEATLGASNVVDAKMTPASTSLEGVVVTALGITREKKSLGYATQQISGDAISTVKGSNFVTSIAGKVAGVNIKSTGNMGGSTNIVIRGNKSILGNNQALFVVDGVPLDNSNTNNSGQLTGRNGFDYGNAASDLNQNDIADINVLKGAAATALYGSRAANGVVLITTKKGTVQTTKGRNIGVSISSNITTGIVDKSTFPTYQSNYGAGYGPFYSATDYPYFRFRYDIDGDGNKDYSVPTNADASLGQKFDPNLMVFQYESFYPASSNYHKATPWVMAENGPDYFLNNSLSTSNTVDVTGGTEKGAFRLSYTNYYEKGVLPNSSLKKNNVLYNGSYSILKDLTVSASANFINTRGKGRNSTGYSDNIMSSFRQWMQTNVDYKVQEDLYNATKQNLTWNPNNPSNLAPAYWDNPYFQRYENYETDERNRLIGYVEANWKANEFLSFMARASVDTYNELQEERKANGSASGEFGVGRYEVTSGYSRYNRFFIENNYDLMAKFNKRFGDDWSTSAILGANIRRLRNDRIFASTYGGLTIPKLYSLNNSAGTMLAPEELAQHIGSNGIYLSASVGYKSLIFVDATIRRDQSSTLPKGEWTYYYPSVSASFIFNELMQDYTWLNLGKFRLGYAEVGNDAPWGSTNDIYDLFASFGDYPLVSVPNTLNNADLKPERTKSLEAGLELSMFDNRIGLDLSVYQTRTINQIIPLAVSFATGRSSKYINAGEIENKGIEVALTGNPVRMKDFRWDVTLNFTKQNNKVVELAPGIENLQIASLQGGVSINARVGETYGVIQGTDYIYKDGKRVVGDDGYYLRTSTSDKVLGHITPDWNAGLINSFSYKDWSMSFQIDWQQGGSVYSLDMAYGLSTGLYPETDYINDLGNPVRNSLANGGGLILDGVKADGTPNDVRISADDTYAWGDNNYPSKEFVYDATYIKLREVVISYRLPERLMAKTFIRGASLSLVGSNLWIIHKDLPYADPEASQSSGNIQGWQSGVMPSTRNIGLTVTLNF